MTNPNLIQDDGDTLDLTPAQCDACGEWVPVSDTVTMIRQMARQTHSSPAEYDEEVWCATCRRQAEEREEYLSDPFNEAYERACANGWED